MTRPDTAQATALGIGILGGVGGYLAGLPLPWMLGPMIANTAAAMLRAPVAGPDRLRPLVIPVIGVMLGSGVTAEWLGLLGLWVVTLLVLPLVLAAAAGISYAVYRRVGGYDPVTAFYSAMPGGIKAVTSRPVSVPFSGMSCLNFPIHAIRKANNVTIHPPRE